MLRTTALAMLMAASFSPVLAHARTIHADPAAPTVILVHGAFADASSWDKVIPRLQMRGVHAVAVDNPLTSLADDVAATRAAIAAAPGKVVLVYVAAFAPDVGENSAQQGANFPVAPGLQHLQEQAGFLSLPQDIVAADFAQDLKPATAQLLYQRQIPLKAAALSEPVDNAAWRTRPSWYVLSRNDRMLSPQLQAATAARIGAELRSLGSGHASPVSEPAQVADAILEASGLKPADRSPGFDGG